MSADYSKDAVTLYYIEGDKWSVIGEEKMEGPQLIGSVYRLLYDKCSHRGPKSRAALYRKARGDPTFEWTEQYSDASMGAGTGLAMFRTFDCDGNRVEFPGLPLTSGISDVRMRHTEALPAIDLRSSMTGRNSGNSYVRNWVMDKVFTDKVSMDTVTGDTSTSAQVAVSRCPVSEIRKMAQILGRTKPLLFPGDERITGVLFRSVPDKYLKLLEMLLETHHPALAEGLKTQWRSERGRGAGNAARHSGHSNAADESTVSAVSLERSEGPAYDADGYVGYYVGDTEDISRLDAEENR